MTSTHDRTTFQVVLTGRVFATLHSDLAALPIEGEEAVEALEGHLDTVMDELLKLEAQDPAIDADLGRGLVEVSVAVATSNPVDATNVASALIRAAIHAAGGLTPDWPTTDSGSWGVVLEGLSARIPVLTP